MRRVIVVALATALLASLTTYALASHFTDVPDGHPFHDEIASMAAAGITTGFPDGSFHPSDNITRSAMSAFMERGNTRLGFDSRIGDSATTLVAPNTEVPMVTFIAAGASGGGGGYALTTANMVVSGGTGCPCLILIEMRDFSNNEIGETFTLVGNGETDNVTLQGADNLPADGADIYFVQAFHFLSSPGDEVTMRGDMSTVYIPFDADAANDTVIPSDSIEEQAGAYGFDLTDLPDSVTQEQLDDAAAIIPESLKSQIDQ